ncbi:MAG: RNA polymerase factor sigma-54, partial [Candidatus Omnitrophota bacterium]|nr:RNA polymerase factor sigma-54 [Candidatus Omnitrophota bacterium]
LQLPLLELKTYLEQEMQENPILEDRQESGPKDAVSDKETERLIELSYSDSKYPEDYFNPGYSREDLQRKQGYRESLITKLPTLQEYLLRQLRLYSLSELDYKIGERIIGRIDENGYFQGTLEETAEGISNGVKAASRDAEKMLSLIQTFEPQGVGARSLKECLIIQLNAKGKTNSLAYRMVENYLTDLAKSKTGLIAKRLKVTQESVKRALKEISALEPKPGRAFSRVETRHILPDIIVEKVEDNYEITVNGRSLPSLKINSRYRDLLLQQNTSAEVKKYLKERLSSANWLVNAINQRRETIQRVAECIVQWQGEFFERGSGCLKPLTMKEVAQRVGRNESTISRVVNNKYIQTPYGVFKLSYFFSGSFKAGTGGSTISTNAVKTQIAGLIKAEERQRPLSDAKIVKILRAQGINVARRTIAKYREELKILPSHFRKK